MCLIPVMVALFDSLRLNGSNFESGWVMEGAMVPMKDGAISLCKGEASYPGVVELFANSSTFFRYVPIWL